VKLRALIHAVLVSLIVFSVLILSCNFSMPSMQQGHQRVISLAWREIKQGWPLHFPLRLRPNFLSV
jgi:hypothetical protein